jgi:L-asparaginase II
MPPPAIPAAYAPLVEVTRGPAVESVHQGAVAVVDRAGRVLYAAGDPHALTFTRSSLKPLQALAEGRDPGDLTTIEDPAALAQVKEALVAP